MIRFYFILLLIYLSPAQSSELHVDAEGVVAEIVWSESSETENQIRYASFNNGKWNEAATPLYLSNRPIIAPFLLTDSDGGKMLIWSEFLAGSRVVLKIQRGIESSDTGNVDWFPARLFEDKLPFSSQAVAEIDLDGRIWVFWAGDTGSDSNIYQKHFYDGKWSSTELAHPSSDVPEYNPLVEMLPDGTLRLSWESYDDSSMEFMHQERLIGESSKGSFEQAQVNKKMNAEKQILRSVPKPDFLPPEEVVRVHFPANKYNRNKVH